MSKAFTQESDDDGEFFLPPPLPSGLRNYMTPAGAARLAAEIKHLQDEKNRLNVADVAARSRVEKIAARLTYLVQRFDAAHIVDPAQQPTDRVLFGARVTLRDAAGTLETWRIVGIDEMNLDQGDISWTSPLASALLDKKIGERLNFLSRMLTVVSVEYPPAAS